MNERAATLKPRPAPPGWVLHENLETFAGHAGPFYFREKDGAPGVGFYAERHHANRGGVIHGGALMTLADMSLWDICRRAIGSFRAMTVTMNAEFIGPGPIGEFIEATGEMTRAGKTLLFARGLITAKGESLVAFSGTLKRFS